MKAAVHFKGRVSFKCYNPTKPAKWHLKLFEVTDAKTGYVAGFEVFMGQGKTLCSQTANVMDPNCTVTTKTAYAPWRANTFFLTQAKISLNLLLFWAPTNVLNTNRMVY